MHHLFGLRAHRRAVLRAFTLVELVVVVVILGILAAVAVFGYSSYIGAARDKALVDSVQALNSAITARSAADDKTPSAVVSSATANGGLSAYLSIRPGNYVFTVDPAANPSFVRVQQATGDGSRSLCLTLGTAVGQAGTPATGCVGVPVLSSTVSSTSASLSWTPVIDAAAYTLSRTSVSYTQPTFSVPWSDVFDSTGNLYVTDAKQSVIRKMAPDGTVTTLAGSTPGFKDGTGSDAQLNGPKGIAISASGNLYVADQANNSIRKITPAGVVTTLAGSSTAGLVDATGTAARFNDPYGVAVDANENVYVADRLNSAIRKITPAGVVTTLAGGTAGSSEGTGSAAQFYQPGAVALDASGNVLVADTGNNRIRKVTPAGVTSLVAGSTAGIQNSSIGSSARLNAPRGITVGQDGNYYVTEYGNNDVRMVTPAGAVTYVTTGPTSGYADGNKTSARFNRPYGIAQASSGVLYVVDQENQKMRMVTLAGDVTTLLGNPTSKTAADVIVTTTGPTTLYSGGGLCYTDTGLKAATQYTYTTSVTAADGSVAKSNDSTVTP